jgi:hypothetical protein
MMIYRLILPAVLFVCMLPLVAVAASEERSRSAADTGALVSPHLVEVGQEGPTVLILLEESMQGIGIADVLEGWPLVAGRVVIAELESADADAGEAAEEERSSAVIEDLLMEQKPDYLLLVRARGEAHRSGAGGYGNTILAAETADGLNAAAGLVDRINRLIDEETLRFERLRRPAEGTVIRRAADEHGIHSMLLTVADVHSPGEREDVVVAGLYALLERLQMVEEGASIAGVDPRLLESVDHARLGQGRLRVALFRAHGVGANGIPAVMGAFEGHSDVYMAIVDDEAVRRGVLEDFDVALFCGGSGSAQGNSLRDEGREKVRQFIDDGGGYVGICAGGYLACHNYTWGLKIIDARTRDSRWRRGRGYVEAELTEAGREFFGDRPATFSVRYANGPIIEPAGAEGLISYTTLAYFRTEMAENNTIPGLMENTPAIAIGAFGGGRVAFVSPHPESDEELHDLVRRLIRWAGGE